MKLGVFQFSPAFGDKTGNLERIAKVLESAGERIPRGKRANPNVSSFADRRSPSRAAGELQSFSRRVPSRIKAGRAGSLPQAKGAPVRTGYATHRGIPRQSAGKLQKAEGNLVVLPELCTTGYQFLSRMEAFDQSEPVPGGRTTEILSGICRDRGLFLVFGMAERCGDDCFNSAVLIGPEGWIGTYRKAHLFWDEKLWFSPGTEGFPVFNLGFASVGLMVCFDWIFPEAARSLALSGADIICHPSNLVLPYCPDAMITRSIENRVFTATANRTGAEKRGGSDRLVFIGSSQITDPSGEVLVRMGREEEGLSSVRIDPLRARDKRITPKNHLWEDRKADLYTLHPCTEKNGS